MGYWITLRRRGERRGFQAATAPDALAAVETARREGWEEVRIIDPDGIETTAYYLQVAVHSVSVESV